MKLKAILFFLSSMVSFGLGIFFLNHSTLGMQLFGAGLFVAGVPLLFEFLEKFFGEE